MDFWLFKQTDRRGLFIVAHNLRVRETSENQISKYKILESTELFEKALEIVQIGEVGQV